MVDLGRDTKGGRIRRTKTIHVTKKLSPKKLKEFLDLELAKFQMEVEAGNDISLEKKWFKDFAIKEWFPKFAVERLLRTRHKEGVQGNGSQTREI